jgi:hypothetical protein
LSHITKVSIECRHKCRTIGSEEDGRCGCGVGVVHGGIPHDRACPPVGGAHGGGQYPWPKGGGGVLELWPGWSAGGGGGPYPAAGGGDGHIEGCPATGDPPHEIMSIGPK